MALRSRRLRVEPDAVVFQGQDDVLTLFAHGDPHVPRLRVLQRVHHALARDVEHEQGDRGGKLDVLHVPVEADGRVAADLVGERLQRLGEPLRPERRTVQVSDQCSDPVGGLLLRLADLVELSRDVFDLALLEELPGHVDLDREAEQDLREIVVEIAGDLQSFVG
ncbi:MAG TPA: hypothetical protein VFP13_04340, partial [Actinomycetota bacterium]|nr:hypothetical protein [Actinomycetota bacterium]